MGSNGAGSSHARPTSAYTADETPTPEVYRGEHPDGGPGLWTVDTEHGLLPTYETSEYLQRFEPGPPIARIATYMSTRVAPEHELDVDVTSDNERMAVATENQNPINAEDTMNETSNVVPSGGEGSREAINRAGHTCDKDATETNEDLTTHGVGDIEMNTNSNAVVEPTREVTSETISEVSKLQLTVMDMSEHVTPRIDETDDVASAFEKHARIAQRSRAETYRKQTPVQSMNESLRLKNISHESTIMSESNADAAHTDTDPPNQTNEKYEEGPNRVAHATATKPNTKAVVTLTDKHAKCKSSDWQPYGEVNSVFSNPWQAVRKEASVNRNKDNGQRYKHGRLLKRKEKANACITDSETQTSIDFGNVNIRRNSADILGDMKDRTEGSEHGESSEIPTTDDVSARLGSPEIPGSQYQIETVQVPSASGRESALQLRSDLENGRSKQLLELMSKGLGNFTDQMADVMITKIRPEYEVLARQVGEEVKDNTMVELKDLRLKVSKARTTLDDLEKDKELLKRELTNERELLKKKIEKDKEKRKKDIEEKNEKIKELASQHQRLQHSMKEYERMYKRAEHKAKHEEHKRVKADDQYQKNITDIKKQLDKVKGDLLVQKSLRRLTAIANERKAQSASGRRQLLSHHGTEHKPID